MELSGRQFVLIAYDIPDDKRRTKVAKLLEGQGERVQYSVFELHVPPERLEAIVAGLRERIRPSEDHIRVYRLCRGCLDKVDVIGGPEPYVTPALWVV